MKRIYIISLATCISLLGAVVFSNIASANPPGGAEGGGDGTDYETCGTYGYCDHFGGTWVYQSLDELINYVDASGTGGSVKAEVIAKCEPLRAQFPNIGVYRSSYLYLDPNGNYTGKFSGFRSPSGLGYRYPPEHSIISVSTAMAAHAIAKSLNPSIPDYSNSAFFCYDQSWGGGGTPASGDAIYHSFSSVSVGNEGVTGGATAKSPQDGSASLEFSVDSDSINVTFEHSMLFINNKSLGTGNAYASPAEHHITHINNTWSISGGYSDGGTVSTNLSGMSEQSVSSRSVTISGLSPGTTQTVCSTITYPNVVNFSEHKHITQEKKEPTYDPNTMFVIDPGQEEISHTDYMPSTPSGSGRSIACATVTRPALPSGQVKTAGSANSDIMLTGESTSLGWDVNAISYSTRKLVDGKAIVYLVPGGVPYNQNNIKGNPHTEEPCTYYGRRSGTNCQSTGGQHLGAYNAEVAVKVPNHVGNKYCHSFGYKFEYWYYINGSAHQDYGKGPYWHNYDAVCRTIAKKPSVAIWNSGLLTNGGVKVSKSQRYDVPTFGEQTNAGNQSQHLYGSWTEYLSAINLGIQNFSSGSALARGSDKFSLLDNSALTITNRNAFKNNTESLLGYSGITTSSTLRTRLNTFLRSRATPIGDTLGPQINLTGTHIWQHTGDLNIDGNITTHPGNYTSIYQIPQVIIFVDGNVNISSNVNRIDAWIIASGEVNTCREFAYSSTQSDSGGIMVNPCTQQLVFNAPVLASRLRLNRSYGSDPTLTRRGTFGTTSGKETPAEVFNLREDVYLWAYAQAGRYDSSYTESYSRELAPRY